MAQIVARLFMSIGIVVFLFGFHLCVRFFLHII